MIRRITGLSIEDAINHAKRGATIRKSTWANHSVRLKDLGAVETLVIQSGDNVSGLWKPVAEDWSDKDFEVEYDDCISVVEKEIA